MASVPLYYLTSIIEILFWKYQSRGFDSRRMEDLLEVAKKFTPWSAAHEPDPRT